MRNPFKIFKTLDAILAMQNASVVLLRQIQQQGVKLMAQSDDLTAAVAALATASSTAEAAIATELATIAANSGSNPAIATAITNIQSITAGLTSAAASVPSTS